MKPRSCYSALFITASVDPSLFPIIINALDVPFEKGIKRVKFPFGAVMPNTLNYIPVVKNWIPLE